MIYPWLLPLLVLATGIVVNHYFNLYVPTLAAILVLIISAGLNGFFRYIVLNLGVFLLALSITYTEKIPDLNIKTPSFFECRVVSFPDYHRNLTSFDCKILNCDYKEVIGKTVKVYSQEEGIFFYSRLAFLGKGKVEDGKVSLTTIKHFTKVDNSDNPFYNLFKIKDGLIQNYGLHRLNNETFAVGTALIFGETKYLDSQTYKPFVETGLAHLIAISGGHIAILFFSLSTLLFFLSERVRYVILGFLLPFYALFTGFGIPVVRAVFMAVFYVISKLLYLKNNPLNILFFTAFFFLVLKPDSLFSVSFQLSFLATLGIIMSIEIFRDYSNLVKLIVASIFATIFTTPIILYNFYNFSPTSIFATPIATLPLYPLLTLSVVNIFLGFNVDFLVKVMDFFGYIFLQVVKFFASLGLYYTGFSPSLVWIFIYFTVILFILLLNLRPLQKLTYIILTFIVFLAVSKNYDSSSKIYTFKSKKYPVIFVSDKGNCYLIADFEYKKALNLLKKEGCKVSYLLTENPENFSDDFTTNFNRVLSYQYQINVNGILFKKWVEPYILIYGREFYLKNEDNVISLQSSGI
ncbi:MAG: ComEC/Rec2 family competence protein [Sulfurihydrogenibium sp.]|uniref:ComEC/Rec2 family competence protein n=1 Tax=Sulfurihydrogenibium sp. TaxID=2053621 RepID=UPI003C7C7C58